MDKGDGAAKDNPKEHAHINDLKTKDKGLSTAVQLRVGGTGRQAMGQGQPAIVRRQIHQPGHRRHEGRFGFAGFRQAAGQPKAEQKPEMVHQRPEHAGDEFPQQVERAAFIHPQPVGGHAEQGDQQADSRQI